MKVEENMSQPLAILAPGLLCDARLFEPILDVFQEHSYETHLVTHHLDDSLEGIVARLRDEVDNNREVLLVGLSMGGYIVLEAFFSNIGIPKGLVLLNTNARADRDDQKETRRRLMEQSTMGRFTGVTKKLAPMFLSEKNLKNKELVEVIIGMGEAIGQEGYVRQQTAIMNRQDRRQDLPSIEVPTLIMVGEEDQITPPKVAREMHGLIPDSKLVEVPECGHLVPLEVPELCKAELAKLMKKIA
jgi:pimeloyl-ACP methyl ester carboxylesterase